MNFRIEDGSNFSFRSPDTLIGSDLPDTTTDRGRIELAYGFAVQRNGVLWLTPTNITEGQMTSVDIAKLRGQVNEDPVLHGYDVRFTFWKSIEEEFLMDPRYRSSLVFEDISLCVKKEGNKAIFTDVYMQGKDWSLAVNPLLKEESQDIQRHVVVFNQKPAGRDLLPMSYGLEVNILEIEDSATYSITNPVTDEIMQGISVIPGIADVNIVRVII